MKKIWETAWPIIKLIPKFLYSTPVGKRILVVLVVAALKATGLTFSDNQVLETIEEILTWLTVAGVTADIVRKRDTGVVSAKKIFYEQTFSEWFGIHGVASDGGIIFFMEEKYFMARFDENHWLISTEDGKSKVIFERGKDKLIEVCKALS